jgi:hypothetical protein
MVRLLGALRKEGGPSYSCGSRSSAILTEGRSLCSSYDSCKHERRAPTTFSCGSRSKHARTRRARSPRSQLERLVADEDGSLQQGRCQSRGVRQMQQLPLCQRVILTGVLSTTLARRTFCDSMTWRDIQPSRPSRLPGSASVQQRPLSPGSAPSPVRRLFPRQ